MVSYTDLYDPTLILRVLRRFYRGCLSSGLRRVLGWMVIFCFKN